MRRTGADPLLKKLVDDSGAGSAVLLLGKGSDPQHTAFIHSLHAKLREREGQLSVV